MPELPEVETVRRHLARRLENCLVEEAVVHHRDVFSFPDYRLIPEIMAGARFAGAGRRGKFLLLRWTWPRSARSFPGKYEGEPPRETAADTPSDPVDTPPDHYEAVLLVHLRMTGNMLVAHAGEPRARHTHFTMVLNGAGRGQGGAGDSCEVRFHDPRRFGRLWLLPAGLVSDGEGGPPPPGLPADGAREAVPGSLLTLGPEPMSPAFTPEYLMRAMGDRRASVKSLLLQQHIVAGLGNIYVDEVLHGAGIHPATPGGRLTMGQAELICREADRILAEAIRYGGTTFSDFRIPDGRWGGMLDRLAVFRREGQPCLKCGRDIQKIRVAQRGTHYCPRCQPHPES